MTRRLNYANVTATLAVFFAMSGGALAAKHYLINSTKQINPKVLKSLKGKEGPQGKEGKHGPEGKEGKQGKEGPQGTARAYAYISTAGEVSHAKGITAANVTLAGGSLYCIHGLGFSPEDVIASSTFPSSRLLIASGNLGQQGTCPAGTQVSVATYNTKEAVVRGDVWVTLN
jgi:hypothetical protein